MAKSKAAGKTGQGSPRPGKRRGVKRYGGQLVGPGDIIVRQVGARFQAGAGTKLGRDFTITSLRSGRVHFRKRKGKKIVAVL